MATIAMTEKDLTAALSLQKWALQISAAIQEWYNGMRHPDPVLEGRVRVFVRQCLEVVTDFDRPTIMNVAVCAAMRELHPKLEDNAFHQYAKFCEELAGLKHYREGNKPIIDRGIHFCVVLHKHLWNQINRPPAWLEKTGR